MTTPPHHTSPFIGRRRELSEVRQALGASRLVTLSGPGGTGKTRLALEIAQDLERSYRSVYVALLADVTDEELVGLAVAEAAGLEVQPGEDPVSQLAGFIGGRSVLLVLDNCEHVLDAGARLAASLVHRCGRLTVLATSRQALGVTGEVVYPVPPLGVPRGTGHLPLQTVRESEAVRLFVDRASSALPGFALTGDNGDAVARLCVELEGLPLALELAAARIRVLTPDAMVQRLRDRHRLLSRGFRDAPGRHRSLTASIEWSHELCSPEERLLWARLSVFSGGFTLEAAEQVCSGADLPAADVLDVLSDLVDKSLVSRDPGDPPHFRMLETIRQYGAARLEESGERPELVRRHRAWFADLARRLGAGWLGPDQCRLVEAWRREHANLRVVLDGIAHDPREAGAAMSLVTALEGYWLVTGQLAEARHWLDLALSHGTGAASLRAAASGMCAYVGSIQGDAAYARDRLRVARELLAGSDDPLALGYVAFSAASMHLFAGESAQALVEGHRCVDLFRRVGHRNHVAVALFIVGLCHATRREREAAKAALTECLAMTEAVGEHYTRALALWALGLDARDVGDLDEAEALEVRALRLKWELGDQPGIAIVLEGLATVAAAKDDPERAATLLGAAAAVWQHALSVPVDAPFLRDQRALAERQARDRIGDRRFVTAHRHGWSLRSGDLLDVAVRRHADPAVVPEQPARASPLTRRETEVAGLVSEGLTNQQIATRLGISVRTAQGHVESILRKLGFSSRAQVAAWVTGRGPARP